jgi:hypothetical protein
MESLEVVKYMTTSRLSTGLRSRTFAVITKVESIPLMAPLSGEVTAIDLTVAASAAPTNPKPTIKVARSNKYLLPFIISSSGKMPPYLKKDKATNMNVM